MRSGWALRQSHGRTTGICRACLHSIRVQAASGNRQWAASSSITPQPWRRGFNSQCSRLHAPASAQAVAESVPASTNGNSGNAAASARPQFGGLAGSRRGNGGPIPEENERVRFMAARQPVDRSQNRRQHPANDITGPSHGQSGNGNKGSKPKFTITRLAQDGPGFSPMSNRTSSQRRQEDTRRKQSPDSTIPLPQRTRLLRQEGPVAGASAQTTDGGWGSLKRRDRSGDDTYAGRNGPNRPFGDRQNSGTTRRTIEDTPYYKQANEREAKTRSGGYVGLSPNSDSWRPSQEDVARSVPDDRASRQRGSHRFDSDDALTHDKSQRRDQRSFDAPPRSRRTKAGRREQKFADDDADDLIGDMQRSSGRDKKQKKREKQVQAPTPIELPPFISVQSLAIALRLRPEALVTKLEELGFEEVAMDHVLDAENAGLVAMEYNFEPIVDRSEEEDLFAAPATEDSSSLPARPPVITIMGHVDHGKTTILDYLRKSAIAASEHGGITQHIGAFVVPMASGKLVTFLDTPGHAAFLSMRERGANVTDIVILVVAADDSVKPQTIEAIKHAKAAKVPIIVAINKVDKDQADVLKVKQDLMVHDIEVEDFGGDYQAIEVSGKTGQGMDNLEEAMLTQAELLDMRAPTDGPAEGWIIEASTKKSGRTATVLVRRGTLRIGDVIVAGLTWGRVRTLRNEHGEDIREAGPGTPVEVDGWRDQPAAGDEVLQAETEQRATSVVRFREERAERSQAAIDMQAINDARRLDAEKRTILKAAESDEAVTADKHASTGDVATTKTEHKDLYVIVKADVSGSTEAVSATIESIPLGNQPVSLHVLRADVGGISEFDLDQMKAVPAGEGLIVSFNQRVAPHIAQEAERAGIKILDENIIYKVVDNVRSFVEDHLPPVVTSRVLGEVEIAQVFEIKVKKAMQKIAGSRVRNGSVFRNKKVKVYRGEISEGNVVHEGLLSSLKHHKRDVQEMKKGSECGLGFEDWDGFEVGDIVQCYEEKSEKRRLM